MDKICNQAIKKLFEEVTKDEHKTYIESNILDHVVHYIGQRLYPYILSATIFLSVLAILLLYLIYLGYRIQQSHLHYKQT